MSRNEHEFANPSPSKSRFRIPRGGPPDPALHDNLWSINVWGHHLTSDLPSIRKELQRWKRESDREYNQPTPQSQILDRAISFCDSLLEEHKAPVSPEGGSAVEERSLSVSLRLEVRYDPTASVWVGHCPGMNLTSQGTTRERAFLAVEEAVLLFLKYRQGNA